MTQTLKWIIFSMLVILSSLLVQRPANAQGDSSASSSTPSWKSIATGRGYFGIDLGLTGSDYIGTQNFLWGIVTSRTAANVPTLATYLPFSNLGSGVGFVGGIKAGVAVGSSFDLEGKLRFMTNAASREESSSGILLDTFHPGKPAPMAAATDNYSVTLSSIDLAFLGHYRLSDSWYGIGGVSASVLVGNAFSAHQQLSGSYLQLANHGATSITSQQISDSSLTNWFNGFRGDIQVGVGSVFRIGSSSMLLDAELLVGIPITPWLTKVADSSIKATASYWEQPTTITDPKLWYATLTIGIRFPFHPVPPPPVYDDASDPRLYGNTQRVVNAQVTITDSGVVLSGHVIDAITGKPLSAEMTAVDLSNNSVLSKSHTDSDGNYSVRVKGPGKYSVTANAEGHLFGTVYFEVDSERRILKNPQDIPLGGLSGGKTRLLIFFDINRTDLQPASAPELEHAIELMQSVPTMNVEIAGYSDSLGTLQHNIEISLKRAKSVREYLIKHGIAAERITAKGYGPVQFIAPNDTEQGRAENRRVEFVVEK